MCLRAVLFRAPVADVGTHDDQRGPLLLVLGVANRLFDGIRVRIVPEPLDVPVVALEPADHVLPEGDARVSVDGDPVVVIQINEPAKAQRACQRSRLGGDPFHQVPVRNQCVHEGVQDRKPGPVEAASEETGRHGHTDPHTEALTQRAGRCLDPGRQAVLRVPRRTGAELPEAHDVVEREVEAAEMQQRVEEHRRVPVGEHETITVRPMRIGRVMLQVVIP